MTPQPDEPEVAEPAAYWFARMRDGDASNDTAEAFRAWIHADPKHAEDYRRHQMRWAELGLIADEGPIIALRADALRQASVRLRPFANWRIVAAGLALAIGLSMAIATTDRWLLGTTYRTGSGERLTATLPDRSQITLAPLTQLHVRYTGNRRHLELRQGQAYFQVAHDTDRPFSVTAVDRVVTALGTQFQVTIFERRAEVVLVEGSVSVAPVVETPGLAAVRLLPGQRLAGSLSRAALRTSDVETEIAWRTGRLVFRDEPLSKVVERFNRYSADRMTLADPQAAGIRVSGSFRYEGAEDFATALEETFGLDVAPAVDGSQIISSRRN